MRVATCCPAMWLWLIVFSFWVLWPNYGQDYFTPFEPSQLLGRAKAGDPPRKNARKQNLACLMS